MPLSHDGPLAQNVPMGTSVMLLVKDPLGSERLVSQANNHRLRLLARVFGPSMDRQLAAGVPPESRRLLAARAEKLVAPVFRASLARNWHDLLERAHTPQVGRIPRIAPCRDRILAAEADIRSMLDVLAAPRPSSARGVAMVSLLLSDGAGPLYNRVSTTGLPRIATGGDHAARLLLTHGRVRVNAPGIPGTPGRLVGLQLMSRRSSYVDHQYREVSNRSRRGGGREPQ